MRINNVSNIEFGGKLKSGDLINKLNRLNNASKAKLSNIKAKSEIYAEASVNKFFDNNERLTSNDYVKILGTASSSTGTTYSTASLYTTQTEGTWSIYSSFS